MERLEPPGEGHAELSPQPEPPDAETRSGMDDGPKLEKKDRDSVETEGDEPSGEPL
jgi:hypothetical protein